MGWAFYFLSSLFFNDIKMGGMRCDVMRGALAWPFAESKYYLFVNMSVVLCGCL